MPFDANLVLHDGAQTIANATPTSVTRTSGYAVLDLKETAVKGLVVAVVIVQDTSPPGACEMVVDIQCSDTLAFTDHEAVRICGDQNNDSITNNDVPGAGGKGLFMRRIATKKRYMRSKVSGVSAGAYFGDVFILVTPYAFDML